LVGGLGTDTVELDDASDITATATWAVNGFEVLAVADTDTGAAAAITATVSGAQAESFTSLVVSAADADAAESDDTLTLTVTATAAGTTDLSDLVVADATNDVLVINGTDGGAQVIIGTNANDTIDAGTGTATVGNTLTGGAGDNTFVFAASDSVEASMTSITDYQGAAAASDNDTLTVTAAVVVGDATTDVSANAIFTDAGADVNLTTTDGIMTLSGLAADVALADTLAEWFDLAIIASVQDVAAASDADVVAFEFGGNTYVYEDDNADAEVAVLELTGVTGIVAVGTVAAADTILIA
jgi:hypothetical protein